KPAGKNEAVLTLKAIIDPGWHVYSQHVEEGGPIPTAFTFTPSGDYELIGEVAEISPVEKVMDPNFGMEVLYFSNEAIFEQRIRLKKPSATVKGKLEFMVCDDERCLPPDELEFSIQAGNPDFSSGTGPEAASGPEGEAVKEAGAGKGSPENKTAGKGQAEGTAGTVSAERPGSPHGEQYPADSPGAATGAAPGATAPELEEPEPAPEAGNAAGQNEKRSLLGIFIAGFLGGLLALFMPCIFPMIPLTVSYFTKKGSNGGRSKAVSAALLYGISIIVIYVALGLLITVLFGSGKLNELASDGFLNILFFIILVVFAMSFFGAFELNLPSSWTTFADKKADSRGLTGIFFMAVALGLASFSCTGPIIGSLLVEAASKGALLGPATGMFGFALALAIPFTLFAVFPQWLQSLPKSGGWLNTVKVSLGFLELAFALKFLSTVDMAYHWNLLDRDIFLVLWIVIFGMWGFYLLGKLRFAHDSAVGHLSVPRLFFAIFALGFAIYLIPGLWGAPLKPISSFLPHQGSQDFDMYTSSLGGRAVPAAASAGSPAGERKYASLFHAPLGLDAFFDYEQAVEYAAEVNKPVFIDFTGWSCTNCRRMEASVWPDPRVLERLRNDFVLVQLYVDDKTALPEEEQYVSEFSGKTINTVGKKWSDFQASRFNTNSQPYYVIVDHQGQVLVPPRAFDLDIPEYVGFLDKGLKAFQAGAGTVTRIGSE
ncbi:MAG TPA: cytochrome c biogenesis protein CcdA, partial [Anseongella sp.]|nr:cytochrome c biogenesis protein CcdA [Anseongella sp.]